MKIVVLDGYTLNPGDLTWHGLEELGQLTVYARTHYEKIVERIGGAEIIFTNKTPINKEILDSCPSIKYIGVLATGFNVVDIAYAKEKGIVVCNVPTYGTNAVAQFVFAMLLDICHRVSDHSNAVKSGEWGRREDFCFWDYRQIELDGKTMGIIGYGKIGQRAAELANAFGMKVLYFDQFSDTSKDNGRCQYAELTELLSKSDVISLHCPLLPSTEGIINADSIGKMKQGAIVINTSRGGLVVEKDLADGLNSGKLYYAACDVVSVEPIQQENPLLMARNITLTPHIAWAPIESRERLMNVAVNNLKQFLQGEAVNVVNK